jgi:hypothetical protein
VRWGRFRGYCPYRGKVILGVQMTLRVMFLSVFGSVVAGVALGGVIGFALGALSPQLIGLFMGRDNVGDAARTGTALGLLNGAIFGFVGVAIIVLASANTGRARGND